MYLTKRVCELIGHLSKVRQAMKIMLTEKEPLRLTNDNMTFSDYNVKMDSHIILRDIGPQIGYRDVLVFLFHDSKVFVFEYAGPLVIMLILAMRPSFIYGACDKHLSETAR